MDTVTEIQALDEAVCILSKYQRHFKKLYTHLLSPLPPSMVK